MYIVCCYLNLKVTNVSNKYVIYIKVFSKLSRQLRNVILLIQYFIYCAYLKDCLFMLYLPTHYNRETGFPSHPN